MPTSDLHNKEMSCFEQKTNQFTYTLWNYAAMLRHHHPDHWRVHQDFAPTPLCSQWNFLQSAIQGLRFTLVTVLVSVLFTAQLIRTANQACIAVFPFCVLFLLDFLAMGCCEQLLEIHVAIFSKSKYFLQTMSYFLSGIATNLYLVIYFTISRGIGCAQGTPLSNTLYQGCIYKYFMRG